MGIVSEVDLITKVAILYYKKGLNQTTIAEKLGISRPKVSRLISKAHDQNIVKIEINSPTMDSSYLESELVEKYDLKDFIVVNMTDTEPEEEKKDKLGEHGVEFLNRISQGEEFLGISAGTTLHHFAKKAHAIKNSNFKIIPLVGALNDTGLSYNCNEISNILSANLGGTNYLLNAPALVRDNQTASVFKQESRIKKIYDLYEKLDIAILGIGQADESHPLISGHLNKEELDEFRDLALCGSIGPIFYDLSGSIVSLPFEERIIGIDQENLFNTEFRIGLAVGKYKRKAILGALRSKIINVLITDKSMADWLVKQ